MSSPAQAVSRTAGGPRDTAAARLFVCGLLAGVWEFLRGASGFGHGYEMAAIARSIAAGRGFGNPFEPLLTGLTAWNPPLYPLLLGGMLRLFGPQGHVLAADLLHILMNAAVAALLPRLSRVLFGYATPGVFAGVLWICCVRLMPQWDTGLTVAALVVLCLWTAAAWERGRSLAGAGLLGGAVSLLNPSAMLIFLPWIAYLGFCDRGRRKDSVRRLATVVALVCVCNVPWMLRNYRIWGAPMLRSNFGHTIYASNNDCAESSLYRSMKTGCYQRTYPGASASEASVLISMGEARYDRLRASDAFHWIAAHRGRFAQLTAARAVEFWFPDPGEAPRTAYGIWLATALSIPGIVLLFRRGERVAWFIIAVWLLYPPMYYIALSADRYRIPLLWTSLLPAGYAVDLLLRKFHRI